MKIYGFTYTYEQPYEERNNSDREEQSHCLVFPTLKILNSHTRFHQPISSLQGIPVKSNSTFLNNHSPSSAELRDLFLLSRYC
jgi:hypothetical protein